MVTFFIIIFLLGLLTLIAGFVMLIVSFINKKAMKRVLVVMSTGAAVALVSLGAAVAAQTHENKVEAARVAKQEAVERAERKAKNKKFEKAESELVAAAFYTAGTSEDLAQKEQTAWHDAIFEDAGATVAGKHYTDFSEAVNAVGENESTDTSKITTGEGNMADAVHTMTQNVTQDTKDDLEQAITLAKKTSKLAELALSPSGNYQSFGNDFSSLDAEVADLIKTGLTE